jgi:hypothetical protein
MTGEFEKKARQPARGILREFWDFMKHNKKWWLLPALIMLLILGVFVVLAGTGAGPFIYTLF